MVTPTYDGMFLGIHQEAGLALAAVILGMAAGAVYDVLRAFRATVRHHAAAVFLEDTVFCLAFGFVYFCFCVEMLEGALRGFALAGMIAGFALYLLTAGRLVSQILIQAGKIAVKLWNLVLRYAEIPFSMVLGWIKKAFAAKKSEEK